MATQAPTLRKERLTAAEKVANDKKWYREKMEEIDTQGSSVSYGGVSEYTRRKVNYDLYNGILNPEDFDYVCKPWGSEGGELPAEMSNKDIVSARIKAMEGMEMKRAFPWKPIAVNRDATTRKEEEEYGKIKEYTIAEIMRPIRQKIEEKHAAEASGGNLSEEQKKQIQAKIAEELRAETPDKVRRYMERHHQDPAEVMAHQILQYLIQKERIPEKFSKGWKHALLSAYEVYFVGIIGKKPRMKVVNAIRFEYDRSPDIQFIEDSRWARAEYRMTPDEILSLFSDELTEDQIDELYENYEHYATRGYIDNLFDFSKPDGATDDEDKFIRVVHFNWKAPREIGFLTYIDNNGEEQMEVVDENYKLNVEAGDISLEWEWLPETYQGWKIGNDIHLGMKPVEGQFKDIETMGEAKLQYYGTSYDDLNSQPTSMMDRMKPWQYYHNIAMYRLELLMASDKGKKLLMNLGSIPKSQGINMKKWSYYFESSPFAWYMNEEGGGYQDVNTVAKVIDMSLVSDISKYIEIADFLEKKCGKSVGLPDELIGDVAASAEVGNTKQQVAATSNILEPWFHLHTQVKRNILQAMIEAAKVAYAEHNPGILTYILDDLSYQQFQVDQELLDNSTIGIFVANSGAADEALETIKQLAHAAMQNDKVQLSEVVALMRQKGTQEAEEILAAAEGKRQEQLEAQAEAERRNAKEIEQMRSDENDKAHKRELEKITLKETLQKERELQKQAILSVGFNENKDMDGDGKLDVMEIYQSGQAADIENKKIALDRDKLNHQKVVDKEKIKVEKMKVNQPKSK